MGLDPNQIDHRGVVIRVGNGGWVQVQAGPLLAFARFQEVGGRLVITEHYLRRRDGVRLGPAEREAINWGNLEGACNRNRRRAAMIRSRLSFPGPDLARAAASFSSFWGESADHWLADMIDAQLPNPERPAPWPGGGLANERSARHEGRQASDPALAGPPSAVVEVPAAPYGDGFYRSVAERYEALRVAGVAPNKAIAAANGVPKTTADRWVRVAKRRGFLDPQPRGNPNRITR